MGEVQKLVNKYNVTLEVSDGNGRSNGERQNSVKRAVSRPHGTNGTNSMANTDSVNTQIISDNGSNERGQGEQRQHAGEHEISTQPATMYEDTCGTGPTVNNGGCASNGREESGMETGKSCTYVPDQDGRQGTAQRLVDSSNGRCVLTAEKILTTVKIVLTKRSEIRRDHNV